MNDEANRTALDNLKWKQFKVLDQGFVCLVDAMGDDAAIVQAARTSYGTGTKSVSDDETLIKYLMRHAHTTPFEMCEVKLLVQVPMDCWRQYIRHRTASVNEYSTRYSEAIDIRQCTPPDQWRSQSQANKQGSSDMLQEWPEGWEFDEEARTITKPGDHNYTKWTRAGAKDMPKTVGEYLTQSEERLHEHAVDVYQERLSAGVAREQARKDLPLSTYTRAYWKIDLYNLLHFLALRMDEHAQYEIRQYANVIGNEIVAKLFPAVWKAFVAYKLNALTLSMYDGDVIKTVVCYGYPLPINHETFLQVQHAAWSGRKSCRERDECWEKLCRLGIGK